MHVPFIHIHTTYHIIYSPWIFGRTHELFPRAVSHIRSRGVVYFIQCVHFEKTAWTIDFIGLWILKLYANMSYLRTFLITFKCALRRIVVVNRTWAVESQLLFWNVLLIFVFNSKLDTACVCSICTVNANKWLIRVEIAQIYF